MQIHNGAGRREADGRELLIDVSRLIWRAWRGRAATGIDRVCMAYVERFGSRAQAVVQRRGRILVLSPRHSDRIFRGVSRGLGVPKVELAMTVAGALRGARSSPPRAWMTYLNVGHTGLDEPALPRWIAANRVNAVYLVHDLIPLTHPQYCRAGEADRHARRMIHALGSARGILANSSQTLAELRNFTNARGLPMPPNVAAWISGYDGPTAVEPMSLGRPHFVTVGTIEARKNHLLLLSAWDQLVADMGAHAPILVIIGGRGWEAEETIRRLDELGPLRDHVREIGSCSDGELAAWIAGAQALLMPSFVEGFGLPVIESLALGTPVIASDLPVYREIVGDLPTYLDPADSSAWVRTIRAFIGATPERTARLKQMRGYRAPSWDDHFKTVETWLAELPPHTALHPE